MKMTDFSTRRISWLDMVKLISIYLVIWGHALQYLNSESPMDNPLWVFIYSFHMPLFMLLAGYFSANIFQKNWKDVLYGKFKQLVLPCIIWGGVTFILMKSINHGNTIQTLEIIFFDNLWFLKSLFFCIFMYRFAGFNAFILILSLAISQILPFKLPQMYPCFICGVLLRKIDFLNRLNNKSSILLIVLFTTLYVFFDSSYLDSNLRDAVYKVLNGELSPFVNELWKRFFRLLVGVVGALTIISSTKTIFQVMSNKQFGNRLARYGSQTQAIYIIHGPIMIFILGAYLGMDMLSYHIYSFVFCPVISFLLLAFSLTLINICPPKFREILFGSAN